MLNMQLVYGSIICLSYACFWLNLSLYMLINAMLIKRNMYFCELLLKTSVTKHFYLLLMNTDSLAQCSSYFSSIMIGSIRNRSSGNYKIPKKKETITLRCSLIRKKNNFWGFWGFNFGLCPKSKTRKSRKVLFT